MDFVNAVRMNLTRILHDLRAPLLLINISRMQGITLIFVSHDIALAQHFQHVVNLTEINRARISSNVR